MCERVGLATKADTANVVTVSLSFGAEVESFVVYQRQEVDFPSSNFQHDLASFTSALQKTRKTVNFAFVATQSVVNGAQTFLRQKHL